jgi:hypothetical protein
MIVGKVSVGDEETKYIIRYISIDPGASNNKYSQPVVVTKCFSK